MAQRQALIGWEANPSHCRGVVMTNPSAPTSVSVAVAARRLGISGDTCRAWFDAGELPGYRTPSGFRRIIFPESDPSEEHVSVSVAAQMLGVGIHTVRSRFDEGRLAGYRTPNNQRRITRSSIDRILARRIRVET